MVCQREPVVEKPYKTRLCGNNQEKVKGLLMVKITFGADR
jgi:hypothetical protein